MEKFLDYLFQLAMILLLLSGCYLFVRIGLLLPEIVFCYGQA